MDAPTPAPLIHLYDTSLRAIRCGVKGQGLRSTKHVRGVSCEACIGAALRVSNDPAPDEPVTRH
jgi:hypothetical protein